MNHSMICDSFYNINFLQALPDLSLVDIAYIETGHAAKGSNIWLCDDDLDKIYVEHRSKTKILLWCCTGIEERL